MSCACGVTFKVNYVGDDMSQIHLMQCIKNRGDHHHQGIGPSKIFPDGVDHQACIRWLAEGGSCLLIPDSKAILTVTSKFDGNLRFFRLRLGIHGYLRRDGRNTFVRSQLLLLHNLVLVL